MSALETAMDTADTVDLAIGRVAIHHTGHGLLRRFNTTSADGADHYELVIPCKARIRFHQSGQSGDAAPGEYILLDPRCFYELASCTDIEHWRVTLPAEELRQRISAVEEHLGRRFAQDTRMAGLLANLVAMIATTFRPEPPPNPEALATEVIAFVALALNSEVGRTATLGRTGRRLIRQRVLDYIGAHLCDPALTPRTVAAANQISLSYLYSLLGDTDTTVTQLIQARRLQLAYEMLVSDTSGGLTVSEIAYRVGFKSAPHFSRSFSRHFRVSPRKLRAALNAAGAAPRPARHPAPRLPSACR